MQCLRFSPPTVNATFLIAGSWDNNVRCWEIKGDGSSEPKSQQSMQVNLDCTLWTFGRHKHPVMITRIMVTVGQSPWDDIKILGPRLGHLISIFWAMWDTHYPSPQASPLRCPRASCVHIKRGHVTIIEYVTKKCTIIHHFTWRYLSIKPRLSRWDRNGTLISKLGGKLWDIDIKHLTVSHCHHKACNVFGLT